MTLEVLYLEVTNRCNSKCATCVRTFDLAEPERDVDLKDVRRLVASFPPGQAPRRVVLNGVGEALLHRNLIEIVTLFVATGAEVSFNTNAITLSPEMALALARAGLAALRISIDGAQRATYRSLRGVDALHRVAANTRAATCALADAGLVRPAVSIWFTGTRGNVGELPAMVRLARDVGVSELYFQRMVFRDGDRAFGAARADESLARGGLSAQEERAFQEAQQLASELGVTLRGSGNAEEPRAVLPRPNQDRPWSACKRPFNSAYVTANGNVLPCCVAPFATADYAAITLGNAREQGLPEIWRGARYEAFRARFGTDDPVDCCRRCGVDWSL